MSEMWNRNNVNHFRVDFCFVDLIAGLCRSQNLSTTSFSLPLFCVLLRFHITYKTMPEVTWNDAEQLNRQQLIRRDWCGNAIIETKHCVLCLIDVVVEQFAKVPNEGAHLNLYTHCAFDGDFRFPFVQFFIELHVFVRREKGGGLMRTI